MRMLNKPGAGARYLDFSWFQWFSGAIWGAWTSRSMWDSSPGAVRGEAEGPPIRCHPGGADKAGASCVRGAQERGSVARGVGVTVGAQRGEVLSRKCSARAWGELRDIAWAKGGVHESRARRRSGCSVGVSWGAAARLPRARVRDGRAEAAACGASSSGRGGGVRKRARGVRRVAARVAGSAVSDVRTPSW